MRVRPDFAWERELWSKGVTAVAGVDEVGVGALAGPVVAAAVILAPNVTVDGLADSKFAYAKLSRGAFHDDQRARRCYCDRAGGRRGSGSVECLLGGDGGTPASG